ncbi:MAG: tetratricopeptide repeat protein, partial [Thermodesulfobacteriota bacterium]
MERMKLPQPLQTNNNTAPWRERLLPIIPVLAALILFLPVLGNGFVNWDDPAYVYENLHIRSIDIKWLLTSVVGSNYHPLTMLSHSLDYAIFGSNPAGHHFSSILLHGLNSGLVFLLAKTILYRAGMNGENNWGLNPAAMAAALLFAVHPLHVESVAWVSERKDVLTAFFFLLAILTYIRYNGSTQKHLYWLTLFFFLLALLSKPMAVTLPAVLLLLDYFPLKRKLRSKIFVEKIPFFALSIVWGIITLLTQKSGGAVTLIETYPLHTRIIVTVKGYIFYLYKLAMPVSLAPYYPLPLSPGLGEPVFLLSLAFFVIISLICLFFAMRGMRALPTLWGYYILTLLPVIGLVQVGSQAAADRYSYLPTLGFFILAGTVPGYLYKRAGSLKTLALCITGIAIALLALKTTTTIPVWKDSITLWSHEIDFLKSHRNDDRLASTIALYNRAKAYELQARHNEAIKDYGRVMAINPSYIEAYINRGVIYGKTNRYREAIGDFSVALSIDPYSQ